RDVRSEPGIQGARQLLNGEFAFEAKAHHLAERMHAGVGAPGGRQHRRLAGEAVNGLAERGFDGRCARLRLPPVVAGPLVLDDEFHVHRSTSSTRTIGAPSPWRGPIFSTRV